MLQPVFLHVRPRLANLLHMCGLVAAHTQTTLEELACLERRALGRRVAIEVGTYQGVSACRIARALRADGRLFCVDPYPGNDPCWSICRREMRRQRVSMRVVFLRGISRDVEDQMPAECDFMFIDGDHSYEGLKADWQIVLRRLSREGVVCLHDTAIPASEPHRHPPSVDFFNDVIAQDKCFKRLECCHSMNVLERVD